MKLRIGIALFALALVGGLASAAVGASRSAGGDECGGYACAARD